MTGKDQKDNILCVIYNYQTKENENATIRVSTESKEVAKFRVWVYLRHRQQIKCPK